MLVGLFGAAGPLPCEHGEAALGVGCKRSAERRGKGGVFQLRLGLGCAVETGRIRAGGRVEEIAVDWFSRKAEVTRLAAELTDIEAVCDGAAAGDCAARPHWVADAAAVDAVDDFACVLTCNTAGIIGSVSAACFVNAGIDNAGAFIKRTDGAVIGCHLFGRFDAAGDLDVLNRSEVVAEKAVVSGGGVDGKGDRVTLTVKRALEGLVVCLLADGIPDDAGGVDIGGQDDGFSVIGAAAIDGSGECLQLGERADLQIRLVFGERCTDRHCAQAQDQGQHKQPRQRALSFRFYVLHVSLQIFF